MTLAVPSLDDSSRALASGFTANPKSICVIVGEEPPAVLVACSPDSGVNAGAVMKAVLAEHGGRGGGSATLAQAKLESKDKAQYFRAPLGFDS